MGLDTTHDCWHGSYSSFGRWRESIARAAGLGDLNDYRGFGGDMDFPDPASEPLVLLLDHSDCDGHIHALLCAPLAAALEALIPKLDDSGDWSDAQKTRDFVAGLRSAAASGEHVEFH